MTTPKTRGRKSLLSAALTKKICALLHEGCDQRTACSICGIGERTFHEWKERGRNGEEPYASFFSAASRARDTHKARLVKIVIDAADKDARHAEWLLERLFPQEFGRTAERLLLGEDAKQLQPIVNVIIREGEETKRAAKLAGDALPNGMRPSCS